MGISIAPISVIRHTLTNKSGVQEGKDRGMAPQAFRVVEHAVYAMPFFVNPSAAFKSGCTERDIDLFFKLLPLAYSHSRSVSRPDVEIRHVHTFAHLNPLGSISDFKFIEALSPTKSLDPGQASKSFADYSVPAWSEVKQNFEGKGLYRDLISA